MNASKLEIRYTEYNGDYQEKQSHLKDLSYACPRCLREINDCRCAHYPEYLVQIDTLMLPIIRELNSKGYKTTGCCAGHPSEYIESIYINFASDYDFNIPFPEGGKYSKSMKNLSYRRQNHDKTFSDFQADIINELKEWAESLTDRAKYIIDANDV